MDNAVFMPQHAALAPQTEVRATELNTLLEQYAGKIRILSLDCFDTLLWRKTAAPTDVFYDLQHRPAFRTWGITAKLRRHAESMARDKIQLQTGHSEVKLKNIYQAHDVHMTEADIQALSDDEMAAEIEACYAFYPVVELIRKAHRMGLKIIIVSDTYLNETQLRFLLQNQLPSDCISCISHIFCSSEYGQSKKNGLFNRVLEHMYASPQTILHIGDNPIADFHAAQASGLNAVKLIQHHQEVTELLRMHALSGSYIDPAIRNTRSLCNPFKGLLAADNHLQGYPENTLGYATLGPIMYAFAQYIHAEIAQMKQAGKNPKVVFLMRDAYLPSLACEALSEQAVGKRVRISRFAAYASSFCNTHDIEHYLAERIQSKRFQEMCNQLLLPESVTALILKITEHANDAIAEFSKQIYQEKIQEMIFAASTEYRHRLIKHLQNEVGLQPGDTLVFVDLGYTGTAQLRLAPVFKREFNVDIKGRYLIALPASSHQLDRSGLLDAKHYDESTLGMLVTYIALFEQMCTSSEKSVIDYDIHGNAIYADTALTGEQYKKLQLLQSECLRFIRDAAHLFREKKLDVPFALMRDNAAINLCRLLFLPLKSEIHFLETFQFDFNMGHDDIIPVFDVNKGLTGLKRRGWLHCAKDKDDNMRTNYPAEWRSASLELALMLMSQHRYSLEFALNDLSHRRESLEVKVFQGQQVVTLPLNAMPTHDGYFSILIPVVNAHCPLGIGFGKAYKWVEIESAELIQLTALYSYSEHTHTQDASHYMTVSAMVHKESGLFECESTDALLVFDPANKIDNSRYILRVIFRPIVARATAE